MDRPPHVLVADDDPSLRLMAVAALEVAGFAVTEVESCAQALAIFAAGTHDLVLLDVVMPGIDGYDACRRLRAAPGAASTPIVLMTGLDDIESIDRAYAVGATDFITKPIHYGLVAHRLRHLIRNAELARAARDAAHRLSRAQRLAKLAQWQYCLRTGEFRWSEEAAHIFGVSTAPGGVEALLAHVHPEDRAKLAAAFELGAHQVEYRMVLPDGERIIAQDAEVVVCERTHALRVIGAAQDVTERRRAERRATQLAYFDNLTGLPNRSSLRQYLNRTLAEAERRGRRCAVLALDLDLFKRVNDMLGHSAGDALLAEVARRLSTTVRGTDVVGVDAEPGDPLGEDTMAARLGGDEFIVVLRGVRAPEDAGVVARRILEQLAASYTLGSSEVLVSTSIGIATCPENGTDVESLLDCADAALYHAKERGRNNFQFFTPSIHEKARRRMEVENNLRAALTRRGITAGSCISLPAVVGANELYLHYQPKVRYPGVEVVGVEALIRWSSPALGAVSPLEFIPIAEDTGLIVPLGDWVLVTACRAARSWSELGGPSLRLAVNLSSRQFREPGFAQRVARILDEERFPADRLELEITEGVVMQDTAASQRVLADLKALGVRVVLDDFGTGYSSLSYLTRFPIDMLKIDRSFVRGLGTARAETIVSAIVALSRKLGIEVVAEGVETEAQLEFLGSQGELEIQGYYFAKPMPGEALPGWVRDLAGKGERKAG